MSLGFFGLSNVNSIAVTILSIELGSQYCAIEPKYSFAEPFPDRINKINDLYDSGNIIIYFTARGMGRGKNSVKIAYDACYQQTYEQLLSWGCKFTTLMLGKPFGDVYIDDKAISDKDFFK